MVERDKGNNITGVPSPYGLSQSESPGAEPNREERDAVVADDDAVTYAVDYFDAEEERLEHLAAPTTTPDESWSDGLIDEANAPAEAEWAGGAYKDITATHDISWAAEDEDLARDMDQLAFWDVPASEGPPLQA